MDKAVRTQNGKESLYCMKGSGFLLFIENLVNVTNFDIPKMKIRTIHI